MRKNPKTSPSHPGHQKDASDKCLVPKISEQSASLGRRPRAILAKPRELTSNELLVLALVTPSGPAY